MFSFSEFPIKQCRCAVLNSVLQIGLRNFLAHVSPNLVKHMPGCIKRPFIIICFYHKIIDAFSTYILKEYL